MAVFSYTATDSNGKKIRGNVEANSKAQATDQVMRLGLNPSIVSSSSTKKSGLFKKKVKLNDMVLFTRQLATMVNAGVPLLRALVTLKDQVENNTLKEIIDQICKDVEGGTPLADSLEKHPETFSDIYINRYI